ncbi:MAG: small basic family protein [Peptococcaceae bacterium]|jgi:small basic protein|nr:small basic family protein [Peptococcaceae bacterium]
MYKLILPLGSLAVGAIFGSILTVNASLGIAKYLSIAILAALDSVLGGARALLEDSFDSLIMLSGFFVNALLAMLLAFLGDQIGIDMFMAASICFALRIFSNLAFIRRDIISNYRLKYAQRNAQKQAEAEVQASAATAPLQKIRLISATKAVEIKPAEPKPDAAPNLENTISGLLLDTLPLEELKTESWDLPEAETESAEVEDKLDQSPVKVKAIISPDKKNEES